MPSRSGYMGASFRLQRSGHTDSLGSSDDAEGPRTWASALVSCTSARGYPFRGWHARRRRRRRQKSRQRRENLRRRLDSLDVFRPVKWIGLVFGRYLAVSGQDWAINNDRTLSQTCVFQCYSQIMKELTITFRNAMLPFQVFWKIIKINFTFR